MDERSAYPVRWARVWLSDLGRNWSQPPEVMAEETVKRYAGRLYDGGWTELERTALADYDAGCRV